MTSFGKFLPLLFVLLGVSPAAAGDEPSGPMWPLDLSTRYLTSNFMEFRGGRFHAGLDLKTQSREGFTVRAVEDGYISRVRCTPTAYGRVIYLRGICGKTFVFAHLARFNDDLRGRIEQAQQQNNSYRASLEFKPGQIPVIKGQVLGISGQSGTGGPHLHFEVRDRNQRPINPLDHGFLVEDKLPPVIHRLRAWPVNNDSRINGGKGEWILDSQIENGLNGDLGILNISGPVAFSARMVDASDNCGHKLEPWLIELTVDGDLVYACRNEEYGFSENALQRLEWTDWADWTGEGVPREHWLHRRTANTLTGRVGDLWYLGNEDMGLPAGDHSLVLRVVDHAGGESRVSWILRVQDEPVHAQTSDWHQQSLGFAPEDSTEVRLTPFFSSGKPENAGYKVLKMDPETSNEVLEEFDIWVRTSDFSSSHLKAAHSQGMESRGSLITYAAADWPIESSVAVPLPGGKSLLSGSDNKSENSQWGVYRLNSKNLWKLVTNLADPLATEFLLEEPGLHGVFMDSAPPIFQNSTYLLEVMPGSVSTARGVTFPKWEITPIRLTDPGSGLDTGSITALLDGARLIIEPDGPRDRLLVQWPDHAAVGKHELRIEASDRAGNTSVVTYEVHLQMVSP